MFAYPLYSLLLLLLLFAPTQTQSIDEQPQQLLSNPTTPHKSKSHSQSQSQSLNPTKSKSQICQTNTITAFEQVPYTVPILFPTTHNPQHQPKLPRINSTAWEQWFFEGVSSPGLSGFVVSFSRDAGYSFFRHGNLRVEFYLVLDDGTTVQELDFAEVSSVIHCQDEEGTANGHSGTTTRGEWVARGGLRSYTFFLDHGSGEARVTFRTAYGEGVFSFLPLQQEVSSPASSSPSSSPSSSQGSAETDHEVIPLFHVLNTFPSSRVHVNMTLPSLNREIVYDGTGSHMHMWAADALLKVTEGFHIVRGTTGPFSFFYARFISRVWAGRKFVRALLFRDGEGVIASTAGGEPAQSMDPRYEVPVNFSDVVDGLGQRGAISHDPSRGHILEFVDQKAGRKWAFEIEHVNKHFEMALGGPFGATGFTNRVFGGEVGGCQYRGSAWSEQALFPERIARWRIWVVFGIGMLTNWVEAVREHLHI